ncbi:bifunctional diguanylate cyclase/phosphodiesterase [uncultured Erythrobacter sp.]|uniref:putative bifunctional diguanylate cyclase/phosphodiesterase n=1 Tax=uncultured Erythrobacter sp. TaxID=263913 RepID=UPI00261BD714|nr:bifunctional diguanylate cyclase/phosphodiesterase [uncultured Erythrobacter sp.]
MPDKSKPLRLTHWGLVLVPLATLSLVFALVTLVVIASDRLEFASPAALLVAGALIYASTIFLLSRSGMASFRELEELGIKDDLSRLPNRRALHADMAEFADRDDEVAIALIDLDRFKQVNDHFGHAIGDRLILECAKLLKQICDGEAKCYRLGGDEFAAVLHGPLAGTILEGMCRTLLERLENPISVGNHDIAVGASIGLARSVTGEPVPSSEMLRRADVAMSMAKRGGKMRCTWFNASFDERREAVRELEDELRRGLAKNEFSVLYQPLVDADEGRIVAVEALLRWNRADKRAIGPNEFIPVAEESGIINPLGLWVLRRAMTDALKWDGITLSVNISAAQLRNPEFPIKLGKIIEETGFRAEMLELEVTETCLVLDPVVAERSLDVIRKFGVRISLDDFGTGYASIGFLRQFRFEKLKLDRSLVVQAGEDEGSRAMMLSSIAVARALKMGVTAEGVETREQADMVRLAGCDQIQGWLFFKAMPASEINDLIENQALAVQRQNGRQASANSGMGGTAA